MAKITPNDFMTKPNRFKQLNNHQIVKKIELLEVHNRSAPMGIITETIRLLEVKIT